VSAPALSSKNKILSAPRVGYRARGYFGNDYPARTA
jgi:hypothetical protein